MGAGLGAGIGAGGEGVSTKLSVNEYDGRRLPVFILFAIQTPLSTVKQEKVSMMPLLSLEEECWPGCNLLSCHCQWVVANKL